MAFRLATILTCAALASAQVTVSLTDPSLVFGGNGHYNQTLCGGAIFLPEAGDSLSLNFVGSDSEFEFILNPNADPRNITVQPDDLSLEQRSGAVFGSALIPPLDCSSRRVYRVSEMIGGQLYLGSHTATVYNGGWSPVQYDGTGIMISAMQYYPDPLPGLPTLTSEPSSNGSLGNKKAIIGGIVGGIIGLGLLVGAIVMVYQRRRARNRGEPQMDLLTPGDLTTAGRDEESVAGTPAEKSENATMPRGAPVAITLPWSPQGDSAQVVIPQAAQPQESQALKPLSSPPSNQRTVPNNSDALQAQEHLAPQFSPQQVRLVQDLMDQGVPSPQVAGVVKSMLVSGSSSNPNATVTSRSDTPGHAPDAPPQYDFKDTSTKESACEIFLRPNRALAGLGTRTNLTSEKCHASVPVSPPGA
ncbi:hypothetical protein M407DRAFT_7407 [Tulasnella calospora MUT 4182]|uniref:Uncharacterized protein n=1 Tax=Tulasnella calospora MUT 4182 TaxID=1051891 RepID=A0A0C3QJG5_9AGAM|nr:hypothetical protein M407DRAFT_7407 [Tulasnella calospora MUT 4182]